MKPLIVVVGMHRSGTSFLIRSLNLAGMYIGNLDSLVSHDWIHHFDNERGYWENKSLLELSEKTLLSCNSSWDNISNEIKCSDDKV